MRACVCVRACVLVCVCVGGRPTPRVTLDLFFLTLDPRTLGGEGAVMGVPGHDTRPPIPRSNSCLAATFSPSLTLNRP